MSDRVRLCTDGKTKTHLPLPLTSPAGAVARVAGSEEKTSSAGEEHTLLHRETLLVYIISPG
jgi:hypothetical protein